MTEDMDEREKQKKWDAQATRVALEEKEHRRRARCVEVRERLDQLAN